jgi:hypothetical protein
MVLTYPASDLTDLLDGTRRWIYANELGRHTVTDGSRTLDVWVRGLHGGIGSLDPYVQFHGLHPDIGPGAEVKELA